MESNKYGTPSEQARHEAGWRRAAAGEIRCDACKYSHAMPRGNGTQSVRCEHSATIAGGIATQVSATCNRATPIPQPALQPMRDMLVHGDMGPKWWAALEDASEVTLSSALSKLGPDSGERRHAIANKLGELLKARSATPNNHNEDDMTNIELPTVGELIEATTPPAIIDADEGANLPATEILLSPDEAERVEAARLVGQREGRRQMIQAIQKLVTVTDLLDLQKIKKTKQYKGYIHKTDDGKLVTITTWPQFCELVEGRSHNSVDLDLANFQVHGPEFYERMQAIGIGPGTMRSLRQIPEDERAELEKAAKESSRDEFLDLAETLITRHTEEKKALQKRLEQTDKQLLASRERVEKFRKENEAYAEAEEVRKLAKPKPDKESARLRGALSALAGDAKATVVVTMRKGVIELLDYAEQTGVDERPFIAGLLIDLERAIAHLRADFQIPDKLDADPTPVWLRPGFDPLKAAHGQEQD